MTDTSEAADQMFLTGAYAPVSDEVDVDGLHISGELPPGLRGSFLRNGPNPVFDPSGPYHLFDGDGMLHEVTIADGSASYRNRWVRSRGLEAEISAGRALYGGMANASFPGPELVGDAGSMKNVANTHVVRHAGRTMCLWEAGPPTLVGDDLATLGVFDFDGRLVGPMTAHPKVDPVTGEMFFFGYSALPPYLRYHVADPAGELVRTVEIELPAPVMMHDFAVTDTHVVFLDAPAVFDIAGFASGAPMLQWRPGNGTRLGVMRRDGDGSDLRWSTIEDCYVFHFLNAYDDGGSVVVDGCRLPRMDIGLGADVDGAGTGTGVEAHLTRFEVDLATGSATVERIGDASSDFPRIDDRVAGRRHRFGYLATDTHSGRDGDAPFDAVTVVDLVAGTERSHVLSAGRVTGEPVFAPDHERGDGEGDGWLLSFVHDATDDSSEVIVLDPADPAAGPVATIHLPRRVPFGFHGSWLPAAG